MSDKLILVGCILDILVFLSLFTILLIVSSIVATNELRPNSKDIIFDSRVASRPKIDIIHELRFRLVLPTSNDIFLSILQTSEVRTDYNIIKQHFVIVIGLKPVFR